MKNILILGAGLMQRPAILAGRELGYRTVVVDGNTEAVCVSLADDFRHIDLKDKEAIAALALELQKDGGLAAVFTAGTDFSAAVAYVAEKCGLPGHSFEAAMNASVKTRMRACFEKGHVPSPAYRQITKQTAKQELSAEKLAAAQYPLVIKPVDNMGARGCRMIRNSLEAGPAMQSAIENSRTGNAILEEYMDGQEYSIDAAVYDGTMTITGFADRHIFYPPYFIETGHTMPTTADRKKYLELVSAFALGVRSLGLTRGAAKADIKYTADGPMIGEIAARLSGGYMSGWTYPYASDCSLTKQLLLIACGKKPDCLEKNRVALPFTPPPSCVGQPEPFKLFDMPCVRTSAERAWISIPGKISAIYGFDAAAKVPFVRDVLPRSAVGNIVVFPRNNVEKCGNIITVAPTRAEAVAAAEAAVRSITIRLVPDNAETDRFIKGIAEVSEKGFPPSAYPLAAASQKAFTAFCDGAPDIPADTAVLGLLPACLKEKAVAELRDWNYCTIQQTIERFDSICPEHKKINGAYFWKALIRGGIQGALYASDCR